jgi:membrane protein YqaA with SNARE-associated domain
MWVGEGVQLDGPVSLGALFLSSFVSATLLPGGSELLLFALLADSPGLFWPALGVATLGNTLGGLSSYLLGRLVPQRRLPARQIVWLQRFGAPALLLSWAPLVGDALCLAAGWLRLNPAQSALYLAVGKGLRYLAVGYAALF